MDSEAGADPEGRLADFREEEERCVYRSVRICEFKKRSKRHKNLVEQKQTLLPLRSGSEETVDTVVAVSSAMRASSRAVSP